VDSQTLVVRMDDDDNDGEIGESSQKAPLTLRQQMEVAMDASMLPPNVDIMPSTSDVKKTLLAAVKTEMAVLKSTGSTLAANLRLAAVHPPTSVDAERAFSAAGLLCSKVRSRLEDNTLDSLCFLRSYYAPAKP